MTDTSATAPRLRVKELRDRLGWTQMKLAAEAGMHPTEISNIEHGNRDVKGATLVKLANALSVEVGELFPKDPLPKPPDPRTKPEKVLQLMGQMPPDSGDMSSVATGWAGPGREGLTRLELLKEAAKDLTDEDGNRLTVQIALMAAWWGRLFELKAAGEVSDQEADAQVEAERQRYAA